jgi:hypothetical protein
MIFGMYLGITQQLGASSPHAHLGLLGWLSSCAFALIHVLADPEDSRAGRGRLHWITHNLGLIIQVASLWLILRTGNGIYGMFIGIGGLILILSTLGFSAMVWRRLGSHQSGHKTRRPGVSF